MTGPLTLARTSGELWDALMSAYGLDPTGYDRDLVDDIQRVLGLPDGDVRKALKQQRVTVEALLHAALVSLRPFAGMLNDLLRLYEMAAATRADHPNLLIEYNFGSGQLPLQFDLESFRSWAQVSAMAVRTVRMRIWSPDRLWGLLGIFQRTDRSINRVSPVRTPIVAEWMDVYATGSWPSTVPTFEPTGRVELDRTLARVRSVAVNVLRQCREVSANRRDLQQRARGRDRDWAEDDELAAEERWPDVVSLALLDSDHWLSYIVAALDGVADRMRIGGALAAGRLDRDLSDMLDSLLTRSTSVKRAEAALVEVLDLPAWRRRHELYAAWVLTQIVDAAGANRCALHPTADGKLSFSFRGSHVATITTPAHGPVAVWAELRSPLANPVGKRRRRAIQPDYTLRAAPLTDPASTLAVIECKQYRRANAREFAAALQDYATGHPAARVLLASYGPVNGSILRGVDRAERHRCALMPHLRPDKPDPKTCFATWLRDALHLDPPQDPSARAQDLSGTQPWATIRLAWSHQPADLDLHVIVGADPIVTINYDNRGDIQQPPFAQLDQDVTEGYGPETVTVAQRARLKVVVRCYSHDGTLASSGAQVSLRTPKTDLLLRYQPSSDTDETTWQVAEVLPDGTVIA